MYFKQFYLGCLAHASYMIGSDGCAAVVDPQRDVDQYLEEAKREGLRIRHVLETHLHADFVSGHIELAEKTGAEIWIGAKAGAEFAHVPVREEDEIRLGNDVVLRALETPGHTPESVSWLVFDRAVSDQPLKVLTGDALFIGDVGRPDLVGSKGYTAEQMAGMLFDSLHDKLLVLPDSVEVYPAHGAGSACGRNISSERSSTIGEQRRTNYALLIDSREEFVETVASNLPPAPAYFPVDAEINRLGAGRLEDLDLVDLDVRQFRRLRDGGAIVLDVRDPDSYGYGHIPNSVNIGLGGQYASWAGTLLDHSIPLILVAEDARRAREALTRLARVGIETVSGWLKGGADAWSAIGEELADTPQISIDELKERIESARDLQVLDVRRPAEYVSGHVPGAVNIPLDLLEEEISKLDPNRPTA
ncbi:MAG: MBL fold metallo-hydrolase, partial [Thermoanaerobaculia bacterium]|nr:MBL fold metallo-hydrolase [Thermoanaerobaculia bacterium]